MPEPLDIYDRIRSYRAALLDSDHAAAQSLIDTYGTVWQRLRKLLDSLLGDIGDARAAGVDVSLSWLYRQERYQALLDQADAQIAAWGKVVAGQITGSQAAAVVMAATHAEGLVQAQAGVGVAWNRLPNSALQHLVGALGDGTPLSDRIAQLAPAGAQAIKEALVTGVALGHGPRDIAASMKTYDPHVELLVGEVRDAAAIPLDSAMRISRTETLRAYREASIASYQANDDVVESWIWSAALSGRCCAMCVAMNGTEHPVTEPMQSHVCCRCTSIPKVQGSTLVVESGEDWLRRKPAEVQEKILGKAGAAAVRDRTVKLKDFVGTKDSPKWGTSLYARSYKGAKAAALDRKT